MSRKKLTENLGRGVSTADLIAKKLVEQGLLVRHKVGVAIYYEPIIKEENKDDNENEFKEKEKQADENITSIKILKETENITINKLNEKGDKTEKSQDKSSLSNDR